MRVMFYQYEFSKSLRFGDVVKGYLFADVIINAPILTYPSPGNNYKIEVEVPRYSVVLTPCCSIEKSVICVAPLIKVLGDFFKNPYFAEDLTRINNPLLPNQMMSDEDWRKLSAERQGEILSSPSNYTLLEYFVYAENELFERYQLKGREISYYMVDFKNIQKIKCSRIQMPTDRTPCDELILQSKVLELSVEARNDLRDKIAHFYSRPPKEDSAFED
jgi:hypothetical protein